MRLVEKQPNEPYRLSFSVEAFNVCVRNGEHVESTTTHEESVILGFTKDFAIATIYRLRDRLHSNYSNAVVVIPSPNNRNLELSIDEFIEQAYKDITRTKRFEEVQL